jgi:WD40 repeat protein
MVRDLVCDQTCTAISFLSNGSLFVAGLIDGSAMLWRWQSGECLWKCARSKGRTASLRVCAADFEQRAPAVGFSDGIVSILDIKVGGFTWSTQIGRKRAADGISAAAFMAAEQNESAYTANILACGTDSGTLHLLDTREKGNSNPVLSFRKQNDYIASIFPVKGPCGFDPSEHALLSASGDGTLAVYDCRFSGEGVQGTQRALCTASNDELLSVVVLGRDRRVVCGTQRGFLDVLRWGNWEQLAYRLHVHPTTVNVLQAVDADRVISGSDDGMIRLVPIHPKAVGEIVGESFETMPIEALSWNASNHLVACCGHTETVRIWSLERHLRKKGDESLENEEQLHGQDIDDDAAEVVGKETQMGSGRSSDATTKQSNPTRNIGRRRKRPADADPFFSELL